MNIKGQPDERIASMVIVAIVALALLLLCTAGAEASLADCIRATCRIRAGQDGQRRSGTGVVYGQAGGRVLVLTSRHVVEGAASVTCWFYHRGHESRPISGRVLARHPSADLAAVGVALEVFGGALPAAIPIAERADLRPGDAIVTVGAAHGNWPTAFKGHFRGTRGDGAMVFVPAPAGGRSGSAIFDAEGTQILGIIYARRGDDSEGYAIGLDTLRASIPAACEDGRCLPQRGRARPEGWDGGWRSSPPAGGEEWRGMRLGGGNGLQIGKGKTYPTLPGPGQSEPRQDGPPIDAEARRMAEEALADLAELEETLATTAEAAGGAVREVKGLAGRVQSLEKEIGGTAEAATARAKAEEASGLAAKALDRVAGLEEGLAARIKQRVLSAVSGLVGQYGPWTIGAFAAAVGLIVWLIRRDLADRRKTGDPLLLEKALKAATAAAERTPWKFDDRAAEAAQETVEAKLDRLLGKFEQQQQDPATDAK